MSGLLYSLMFSLGMTLVLEVAFFLVVHRHDFKDFLLLVLVNIITNPVVVLSFWLTGLYTGWNRQVVLLLLELLAVLAEGCYYKKYGRAFRRPFLFSLAANLFSFWTGRWLGG